AGGAAVNQLCKAAGASLDVIALNLDNPTADFTAEPAMTVDGFLAAVAAGMAAVPDDADLLCVGEMGIGNTTSAAALCMGLYGGDARDWTGTGTGVAGDAYEIKVKVVHDAVRHHAPHLADGLKALQRLGGRELAAIAGAVVKARYARVPVLLDGYMAGAAAAALKTAQPDALDHCLAAHVSAEPGHAMLLQALGMRPLLNLDMRLGEASGAALAINIVKAACACHTGMATFAEAGVTNKD
ncbi:MAG: nicotinate-nucleotide--dimethylbenzimidazole phosphoribosyltransferase, partial [Rhodospirillaceae bacterium]